MESFDAAAIGCRAVALYALLSALGLAIVPLWAPAAARTEQEWLGAQQRRFALAAVVLTVAHSTLDVARLSGSWTDFLDLRVERLVWGSHAGLVSLVCAVGLGALAVRDTAQRAFGRLLPGLAFGAVVASFALVGHTSERSFPLALRWLIPMHVALLAFWIGGLKLLLHMACRQSVPDLAAAAASFSAVAVWLVPLIGVAGLGAASLLVQPSQILTTSYGRSLLLKMVLYLALLVIATFNRVLLVPQLARQRRPTLTHLRYAVTTELILLVAALVITASLTTLFGPPS